MSPSQASETCASASSATSAGTGCHYANGFRRCQPRKSCRAQLQIEVCVFRDHRRFACVGSAESWLRKQAGETLAVSGFSCITARKVAWGEGFNYLPSLTHDTTGAKGGSSKRSSTFVSCRLDHDQRRDRGVFCVVPNDRNFYPGHDAGPTGRRPDRGASA